MTRVDDNVGGSGLKVWPVGLVKREVGGADETQLVAEGEGRSGEHGCDESVKYGRKRWNMIESRSNMFEKDGIVDQMWSKNCRKLDLRSIFRWNLFDFFDFSMKFVRILDFRWNLFDFSIFSMKIGRFLQFFRWNVEDQRSFLKRGCRPNASSFKWNLGLLGTFD
jgi:hypothetical protein